MRYTDPTPHHPPTPEERLTSIRESVRELEQAARVTTPAGDRRDADRAEETRRQR
jgi:hypothetical protein